MSVYFAWGKPRFHFDSFHFLDPLTYGPFIVKQVGDLSSGEGYVCPEHMQSVHEISYCVSGKAVFTFDDTRMGVKKGDIIINPRGTRHSIECAWGDTVRYYYIGFDIDRSAGDEYAALDDFFISVKPHIATDAKEVFDAFVDIFGNMHVNDEFSETLITDAIRKLLIWTRRAYDGKNTVSPNTVEHRPDKNRLLSEMSSYLDSSVDNIDAIKDLPVKFGYSYSYLSRVFSKSVGRTLKEYFLQKRYERAGELLADGFSVTATAERLGFSSIHSFSHFFTAYGGISPSEYILTTRKR